ncbi:sulfotransferase 1 family member D1-like [Phlebotomus argentipes]|uniref:sulfotransferase 1 family member D1-like n=1 Tax=Phlebotomus argentipes TaxID=94469 RepID=UPI0028929C64|nr:sulfotransferase 1 family member D1-like [Phlebotomus argentipes]
MSIVCEKVPKSGLVVKAGYIGVEDFVTVQRTERPKDLPIAEKWCMEPCFLPSFYEPMAQKIENFTVRPDDVWVITYPKCGTTWSQEMVWMLCNNLDYEGAKRKLTERFPYIEIGCLLSRDIPDLDQIEILENMPSPRFIKSHLPAHLLPPQIWTVKPKIVYVARNAKDTAISWYHHYVNYQHYKHTFDDFMEVFLNDMADFSPYHSHIIDFWNMRHEKNILFLTFEDMKANHPAVIEKTAAFFGKTYTKQQIDRLADHLSFAKFSKNSAVNMEAILQLVQDSLNVKMPDPSFTIARKGAVGSHKEEMTPELIERFNKFTESEMKRWKCDAELRKIFIL